MNLNQDPKPGYLTTEFWSTLFVHLLSVIAFVLVLTGHTLNTDKFAAVIPSAAVIASAVAQLAYTQARAKTKAAHAMAFSSWLTDVSAPLGTAATTIDNAFTNHVDTVGSTDVGPSSALLAVPPPPAQPFPTDPSAPTIDPATFGPTTSDPSNPGVTASSV